VENSKTTPFKPRQQANLEHFSFDPSFYLRPPLVQTFLGSLRLKRAAHKPLLETETPVILSTFQNTRLKGLLSRVKGNNSSKGLVILLHGWEGSSASSYVVHAAAYLYAHNFDVFRLNLRDHGDSHSLNPGIFYATLIDETYDAVLQAARMAAGNPVFVCGFSLGGNFALRMARRWSQSPTGKINLRHVIAVSPVLNPDRSTTAVDNQSLIRFYFVGKLRRSLTIKQRLFPERYDFAEILKLKTVRQISAALIRDYSAYPDLQTYFAKYNLCGRALSQVRVDTTLITALDDPIIPADDFQQLAVSDKVRRVILPHGGHNGFLNALNAGRFHEIYMSKCFQT
jgi:hypothetical protein